MDKCGYPQKIYAWIIYQASMDQPDFILKVGP